MITNVYIVPYTFSIKLISIINGTGAVMSLDNGITGISNDITLGTYYDVEFVNSNNKRSIFSIEAFMVFFILSNSLFRS